MRVGAVARGAMMARHDGARRQRGRNKLAQAVRLAGVARRPRRALLLGTALQATVVLVLALPVRAQPAPNARPTGGAVVAGSASISRTPGTTTIDQSSQRAALNWRSFDVGSKQAVDFHQPNASAVVLNRVVGPNPSQIAGRITANGQVILQNQDGITFTKGAQINTAGFVATAAGITNKNFMAGHMVFDQPAAPDARVVNEGHITVRQAGIAALVAPQVANSGVIEAKLGRVVLAGAKTATLDLYGDGLVSIDVNGEVTKVPVGPDGKPATALVTNTGTIIAQGGHVLLTARQAAGVVQNLVVAGGTIAAPTAGGQTGQIVLNGIGGSIVVAGALLATGSQAGETGGQIAVAPSGGVSLAATARVDASGAAGGGTVAIGTDPARASGGPSVAPTMLSHDVTVARGATIAADATGKGNGGRVTVLAGDRTVMDGAIAARGGPSGGDGGLVEVSGRTLGFGGGVDVGAPQGGLGSILFDPGTLDIVAGTSLGVGSLDGSLVPGGTVAYNTHGTSATDSVSNYAIETLVGNVTLQATTLLSVQAPITLTTPGQTLSLELGDNLSIATGASITTQGNITLTAADVAIHGFTAGGALTVDAPITTTAGTLALSSGTGGIAVAAALSAPTIGLVTAGAIDVSADVVPSTQAYLQAGGSGGITVATGNTLGAAGALVGLQADAVGGAGSVVAGTLEVAPFSTTGAASVITLNGASSSLDLGTLLNSGESLLRIGAVTPLGGAPVATASSIAVTGGFGSGSVNLELDATGPVSEGGSGALTAGTLSGSVSGGAVTLDQAANAIGTLAAFAVTGHDFTLASTGSLAVTGPVSATDIAVTAGTLGVGGSITAGNTLALTTNGGALGLDHGAVLSGTTIALDGGTSAVNVGSGAVVSAGNLLSLGGAGVTEAAAGTISAGTLVGAGTIGGSVALIGSNTIATVGSLTVSSGDVDLVDAGRAGTLASLAGPITANAGTLSVRGPGTLAVTGTVSAADVSLSAGSIDVAGSVLASADAFLQATATRLSIENHGSVSAPVLLGVQADSLTVSGHVSVAGGTLQVAPDTAGRTVTLDGSSSSLALDTLLTAGEAELDIGGVQPLGGAGTIVAGSIAVTGAFGAGTVDLGLFAAGPVSEASHGRLTAHALSGDVTSGGVTLAGSNNTIDILGNVTVAAGGFTLAAGSGSLAVSGSVTAQALDLTAGTIDVTAPLTASAGPLSLTATGGALTIDGGGGTVVVAGPTIDLGASGGVYVIHGAAVNAGTLLALGGAGVTEDTTATLVAGTLASLGTVTGAVGLAGSNTIASIGSFAVSSGDFLLADGGAGTLTVPAAGRLVADNVTIGGAGGAPGAIAVNGGTIALNGVGTLLKLITGTVGITLGTGGLLDAGSTGGLSLQTGGGGVSQAAGARIVAGTLVGAGTVVGPVDLAGTANAITKIGSFTVNGGDFTLTETGGQTLTVAGSVAAAGHRIVLGADALGFGAGGTLAVGAGTIALAPVSGAGSIVTLGSAAAGLVLAGTLFSDGQLDAGRIDIGRLDTTGSVTAGAVTIDAAIAPTASLLGLYSSGTIAETGTPLGAITVGTLTGAAGGGISLGGTNTIGTIADLASGSGQDFALSNSASLVTLGGSVSAGNFVFTDPIGTVTVAGTISGTSITIDPTAIDVTGVMTASGGPLVLDAGTGGITLEVGSRLRAAGQTLDFTTTGGGVTQLGGTVIAGLLQSSGSVVGTVSLAAGSNTIASIGSFAVSAGDFVLADGGQTGTLAVAGPLNAGNITLSGAGTLALTGSIAAPGGIVALGAGAGGISETGGSLLAGSLISAGTVTGTVALDGANTIAALGSFAVTGAGFTLADGGQTGTLTVTGPVSAADVTIGGGTLSPGTLAAPGTIVTTGSLLSLDAGTGGISLAGSLHTPGTLALGASGGGVTESGSITAGTLASLGTVAGTVALTGSNTIGAISGFGAAPGDFVLADGGQTGTLTVLGTLSAANVTLGTTGATPGAISIGVGTILSGSGGTVALDAGTGGIALAGSAFVGGGGLNTLDFTTAGGGIAEAANARLSGTLQSTGSVVGTVDLAGTGNVLPQINGFVVSGGDLTVIEAGGQPLTVAGSVSAAGHRIALGTDGMTVAAGGSLVAATVAIAPVSSAGAGVTLGASPSLSALPAVDFTHISANEIDIGRLNSGASIAATGVTVTSAIAVPGTTTLGLYSTGTIAEASGGSLNAGTLIGQAGGSVSLGAANSIAALGSFAVSGAGNGFALTDAGLLTVAGAVAAPGQIFLQDTAAGGMTLAAGGILAAGTLASLQTDALSVYSPAARSPARCSNSRRTHPAAW